MKLKLAKNTASKLLRVFVQNTAAGGGAGLTGLTYSSSGLTWYYFRDGDTAPTAVTLATATAGTWTSGGFKELSSANMPGVYEIGVPNAVLSVAGSAQMMLQGAANMMPVLVEFEIDAVNYQAADLGLSSVALPTVPVANTWGEALFIADILAGRINTGQAGSSTTITLDASASSDTGAYIGDDIYLYAGTGGGIRGTGQRRTVMAYDPVGKVATINRAWDTTPDSTSKFITLPGSAIDTAIKAVTDQFSFTGGNVNAQGFVSTTGSTAPGNTATVAADFTVASGLYWSQSITATGIDSTGWTAMVFTLKADPETDSDDEALLTVRRTAAATVTNKALTSNVATLTVSAAHGFSVGESIVVAGVDSTFNGTWTITAVPSSTTFGYAVTAGNVSSVASSGTVSSGTDGLLVYKGVPATSGSSGNASVTVSSSTPNTTVTFAIQAAAMDLPDSGNTDYTWEITRWIGGPTGRKEQIGTGNVTMSRGARRSPNAP